MLRILFAHPDEKLVGIYKRRLSPSFSIDSASDGLSAFRLINRSRPNLILSDYDLPVISGVKLLKYVRLHPVMYGTPFIFLTSREPLDDVLGLGATDWIHTPGTSPNEVIEKMIYHLKLNNQLSLNHV